MRFPLALLLPAAVALAGDSLPSGPQVGDKLPDLKAKAFSGPGAGKEFQLLAATKGRPTLVIFVHQITRPALKFLRPVDDFAVSKEGLAAHIVWLSGDR